MWWSGRAPRAGTDPALVLALVRAAILSGVSIPRALQTVGAAMETPELTRAGRLLLLGAGWDEAWGRANAGRGTAVAGWRRGASGRGAGVAGGRGRAVGRDGAGHASPSAELVSRALEPAWNDGVDPVPLLERAAASWQAKRDRRAREAAARLGVRLVLPLGTCYLPAFVLVGVMPVILATGGQFLIP